MFVKSIFVFSALFIASSLATDCNGVTECTWGLPNSIDLLISNQLQYVNSSKVFTNGQYIACVDAPSEPGDQMGYCDGICVSFKNPNYPGRNTGAWAKTLLPKLRANNCKACGNIPISYENNDSSKGLLSVNFVRDRCSCYDRACSNY